MPAGATSYHMVRSIESPQSRSEPRSAPHTQPAAAPRVDAFEGTRHAPATLQAAAPACWVAAQAVFGRGRAHPRERLLKYLAEVDRTLDAGAAVEAGSAALLQHPGAPQQDYAGWYQALRIALRGKRRGVRRAQARTHAALAQQMVALLTPGAHVEGVLQIGPTASFARALAARGIQVRGPRQRLPHLPTQATQATQVDLLLLPHGLHTCPPQALDAHLAQLAAHIRPGGSLLLREHAAEIPYARTMALTAQAVANAARGVDLQQELESVRNLQPLAHWESMLARHGLIREAGPGGRQAGDGTHNVLVRYTRIPDPQAPMQAQVNAVERRMRLSRLHTPAFLGAPSVASLRTHVAHPPPPQGGPQNVAFLRRWGALLSTFWSTTRDALNSGKPHPVRGLLANAVLVLGTSAELLTQALGLAPLRLLPPRWLQGSAAPAIVAKVAAQQEESARFLQDHPGAFAHAPYLRRARALWQAVPQGGLKQLPLSLWVATACSLGYLFNALLYAPMRLGSAAPGNPRNACAYAVVNDPHAQLSVAHVVHQFASVKGIELPRRPADLTARLLQLARDGVQVLSLGGQQQVLLSLRLPAGAALPADCTVRTRVAGLVSAEICVRSLPLLIQDLDARGITVHTVHGG